MANCPTAAVHSIGRRQWRPALRIARNSSFKRRLVGREAAAGLDDLAQAAIEAFHCVGRIDHLADRRREGKQRHHMLPGSPPRLADCRVSLAPFGLEGVEFGGGRLGCFRPAYAPPDLLKLYIYGYLNRVRSSRRLEAETHRNIEVIWLLRHLKPDFKTIADFRRDNRYAFR